jgi:hypothetical protein
MKIKINVVLLIILIVFSIIPITIVINIVLQMDYDHKDELQYESVCKTVNENSEYYIDYSKKLIAAFDSQHLWKKRSYYGEGIYPISLIYNDKENYPDKNLADYAYIYYKNIGDDEIKYVEINYPSYVSNYDFWFGFNSHYYVKCSIFYVPDEYLTPQNLSNIFGDNYESLYRKDNLFVMKRYLN